MTGVDIAAVVASSLLGTVMGSVIAQLVRRSVDARTTPNVGSWQPPPNRLGVDPDLHARVRHLSDAWAHQHGHPEASFLAAGYQFDAAEDLQRRWQESR